MPEQPDPSAQPDLADRVAALLATDAQFAGSVPDPRVAEAIARADGDLIGSIAAAMDGYADRPALGGRAVRVVRDPATGRAVHELQPWFETVSYAELWRRVRALAAAWSGRLHPGDLVAVLGFTGVDHAVIDLACMYLGAVPVPLPLGSAAERLAPVLAETRPRLLAADTGSLGLAAEAVLGCDAIERLVVFDHDPRVDDHSDALRSAVHRLGGRAPVTALDDDLLRGGELPPVDPCRDPDPDRLAALIYTSGSTGAPKGAVYTASMITRIWQRGRGGMVDAGADGAAPLPTIMLHFMPMSHVNGRGWLVYGLASGGVGYFTGRGDLSALFEDVGLARPTVLSLVPRICDQIHQRYLLEAGRLERQGRPDPESAALTLVRDQVLGGRVVRAMCGSAPLSAAARTFMTTVLGTGISDRYGSTETTQAVVIDQRVQRPPVLDYRLADVPELGYFSTDRPYPRGELRLRSAGLVPGYYKRPGSVLDDDGYYRTGDVFAELAPDRLAYVDRIGNVVKLSQGEFVAVSRLEALFTTGPSIHQLYLYGNPEQAFLLGVAVPDPERLGTADEPSARAAVLDTIREVAAGAGLAGYEVPHDVIIERTPFSVENGLLSGIGKPLRPALKERYGPRLERLYGEIADDRARRFAALRAAGRNAPPLETVLAAVRTTLGLPVARVGPHDVFADLGGDSLAAHTLTTVLEQVFDREIPVQAVLDPGATLAEIAGRLDDGDRAAATFASVHGTGATVVRARELAPDRFFDPRVLAVASPGPADGRTLLTGATGYLGRFLALDRLRGGGERLTVLARAADDDTARRRVLEGLRTAAGGRNGRDDRLEAAAAERLEVLAADVSAPRFGLDDKTWARLADETGQIVHSAALVNHVLPYSRLFAPNVVATAGLVELALTGPMKHFTYLSTIAAALEPDGTVLDEDADVRSGLRHLDDSDAGGYAVSKWAGEVLLRETHHRTGLPVTVFRPGMVLAHSSLPGVLNLPDRFTRLLVSVLATGLAPRSFYRLGPDGERRRAHYGGLPVDFTTAAISALTACPPGARPPGGYVTYNTVNAVDDGISLDEVVDWLIDMGRPIVRFDDHREWLARFSPALRGLPPHRRRLSLLPMLAAYARPLEPRPAGAVPAARFTAALDGPVPSLTPEYIGKYVADLRDLDLV
ncbi:carboxylic acid reductase [Actinomadura sp. 9N215]|uniref:carboxylic acid reductase n=1 Tax=Actinomadura sp. 9N215 TaxID=3375150 RepID=UPI0037A04D64